MLFISRLSSHVNFCHLIFEFCRYFHRPNLFPLLWKHAYFLYFLLPSAAALSWLWTVVNIFLCMAWDAEGTLLGFRLPHWKPPSPSSCCSRVHNKQVDLGRKPGFLVGCQSFAGESLSVKYFSLFKGYTGCSRPQGAALCAPLPPFLSIVSTPGHGHCVVRCLQSGVVNDFVCLIQGGGLAWVFLQQTKEELCCQRTDEFKDSWALWLRNLVGWKCGVSSLWFWIG